MHGCYGVLEGVIGMGDGQGHTFREYDYRDATGIRHVGMGMCIEAVVRLFSWQWHGASGPGTHMVSGACIYGDVLGDVSR